jgi:ribosomal-protein-serine acetyltransferase
MVTGLQKFKFPDEIKTKHLVLKRHQSKNAKILFEAVASNRKRLEVFLPWVANVRTLEDQKVYVTGTMLKWRRKQTFDYGIYTKVGNHFAGNVGVHTICWEHARCEFGYWLVGEYEGHGLMTDVVNELTKFCFANGFHRVEIRCSKRNKRSAAVPKRCGFKLEGQLRQNIIEMRRRRDTLIFGKLNPRSKLA